MNQALSGGHLAAQFGAGRAAIDAELAVIADAVPADDGAAAALRYALATDGKRLRPLLCMAAVDAVYAARGDVPPFRRDVPGRPWVRAAVAVELIHTYSLVHDDLPCMDNDGLRRGRPTSHVVHGTPAAMVAGFALIPLAVQVLIRAAADLDLPPGRAAAAAVELCRGAGAAGMVGGQVLDLEAEGRRLSAHELRRVHALKTGALFSASLRVGGSLAGAPDATLQALGSFGSGLGMAFQITDDILDETMDAEALGKTPGKDREASKSTFPALLGLGAARAAAVAETSAAVDALRRAGLASPLLEALAGFAVYRDR
jgi:geranylgeranyl pyrophosphate synthase